MYDVDSLFDIDFDATNPTEPVKERITAFTKRYFTWIKKAPNALVRSVKALSGIKCEGHKNSCGGTGIFGKWSRKCFRCTDGLMTEDDITRNAKYDGGSSKVNYLQREAKHGENVWGLIA
jgi:hypothetical protein